MKIIIYRVIQLLLLIIMILQVYTWYANLENTGIAHNKYDTTILFKKSKVEKSNYISFIKKEAMGAFDIIIKNEHKKHIGGNLVFLLLPIQIGFIFIIFVLIFLSRPRDNGNQG